MQVHFPPRARALHLGGQSIAEDENIKQVMKSENNLEKLTMDKFRWARERLKQINKTMSENVDEPKGDPANPATVWFRHRETVSFAMRVDVDSRESVSADHCPIHVSATTDELPLLPHLPRCYSPTLGRSRRGMNCERSGKVLLR